MNRDQKNAGDRSGRGATLALLAVCLVILAVGSPPSRSQDAEQAQGEASTHPNATYSLWWRTIDAGGASFVAEGSYALAGTAGQPDAGGAVSNLSYTLEGGFWAGGRGHHHSFLPVVGRAVP